jgi:DNA-binding IscR family transcriptional regulator
MPAKKLSKAYPEDVVRRGYLELLDRRGYFVASPQDLTESIAEIFEVGRLRRLGRPRRLHRHPFGALDPRNPAAPAVAVFHLPPDTVLGLKALALLAEHVRPASTARLAREAAATEARLLPLLRALEAAGLLRSQVRGWCLARPPAEIAALEALAALAPSKRAGAECHADWSTCAHPDCALAPVCRRAHEALEATFYDVTLAQLGRRLAI